jgi:hypothetical protein
VLVLVLEHHVVDVSVAKEGVVRIEIHIRQPVEDTLADLLHDRPAAIQVREWQGAACASGVLEWIEEARHLYKLDGPVEVASEPELLEMRDMTQVPEEWAHEGIVLEP